jgi:hypothetical protein
LRSVQSESTKIVLEQLYAARHAASTIGDSVDLDFKSPETSSGPVRASVSSAVILVGSEILLALMRVTSKSNELNSSISRLTKALHLSYDAPYSLLWLANGLAMCNFKKCGQNAASLSFINTTLWR